MELVVDVYNRLKLRDEVITCPGCGRMLYIPDDLTPEMAVRQKKVAKRASRAKSTKKAVKKDRKGVPVKVKRVLTTAAAESLRLNKEEGQEAVDVTVKITGVIAIGGPYSVASKEDFSQLVQAKLQSEDIDIEYVVLAEGEEPPAPPAEPTGDEGETVPAEAAA